MPVYRCSIPQGLLTDDQKQQIALEITDIHCGLTNGTPRKFVHVTYEEVAPGATYVGGERSTASKTIGLIRTGRPQETRSELVRQLTDMWARISGQDKADILVALQEVRPRDAMEWGELLPEDGVEAAWIDEHGLTNAGVSAT
ncbi:MAG TPA: tautomerase family protein [Actinomycetospora sp.]|jgi:phenylpyruvate tautomerase PptA (4-oxalocrotonate tautomerase family)|uniref:tautomerase family protein n=1 Tax=Actinomycetospora sp. TaxID=1872135 RepID=UPI002F4024C5